MISAYEARKLADKHKKERIHVEIMATLFKIKSEASFGKTQCNIFTKSIYKKIIIEVLESKGYKLNEYKHNCFEVKW